MSLPTPERLHAHPELASLLALAAQLELLPAVLAARHRPDRRDALAEQARSLSRVSQVLANQIRAYIGLVDVPDERVRRLR